MQADSAANVCVYHVPKDSLREGSTLDADPRFPAVDVVLKRDYEAVVAELERWKEAYGV